MAGTIKTKVVGVTFRNADGGDRQRLIRKHCAAGKRLALIPDRANPRGDDALGVWLGRYQLGYVRSELAQDLIDDYGPVRMAAVILGVTGGGPDENLGVNIEIELPARKAKATARARGEPEEEDDDDVSWDDDDPGPIRSLEPGSLARAQRSGCLGYALMAVLTVALILELRYLLHWGAK